MDQANYWLNKWKQGDIAFHQDEINRQLIKYLHLLNLKPGDTLFVPLCGKTRDLYWLAQQNINVIGVELSQIACDDFFSELKVTPHLSIHKHFIIYQYQNIKIFCGDFFNLMPADLSNIHAIYDCKALIALPVEWRKKYVEHLLKCTENKASIFLITIDTENKVSGPPFAISMSDIHLLYGEHFNIRLLQSKSTRNLAENLKLKGFSEIIENIILMFPQ